MYTTTDILINGILGSRHGDPQRVRIVSERANVPFPIPFLPFHVPRFTKRIDEEEHEDNLKVIPPTAEEKQFFPFSFAGEDGERYLLPYEPLISISGGNKIVRRDIAKVKTENGQIVGGSVKERFSQKDYDITITGVLYGSLQTGSVEDCFPREDFVRLRDYVTAPKSLQVFCEPLQLLGINQIVIEDFSFPFTKGEYVQAYEIKAYSDIDYPLLIDRND